MRHFSIETSKVIKKREHLKWLDKHLDEITIIKLGDEDIGNVRLYNDEIAINLSPKYRGKGYGVDIINRYKYGGLKAKIVCGNVASMRVFIKCGFNVIGYASKDKVNYYILKYEGSAFGVRGEQENHNRFCESCVIASKRI